MHIPMKQPTEHFHFGVQTTKYRFLTFNTELMWGGSNTLPLREVTMTRPYLPGVCRSEYSVCLDRFTGNKLSTKFPSIFARLCLGANRYSTFSSMRYLLKLAPSRMEIKTGAEAKNTGWLATKWPSLWNDVVSPSCNTCRNILECSNSARARNNVLVASLSHRLVTSIRSGASMLDPRSWITEISGPVGSKSCFYLPIMNKRQNAVACPLCNCAL